jgi:hypothetical protein
MDGNHTHTKRRRSYLDLGDLLIGSNKKTSSLFLIRQFKPTSILLRNTLENTNNTTRASNIVSIKLALAAFRFLGDRLKNTPDQSRKEQKKKGD